MSNCSIADVKAVHSILGDTLTSQYFDLRTSPPTIMTEAEYNALTLVSCPKTESDFENVCVQEAGNTDAANIVQGMRCVTKKISYADTQGTVAEVTVEGIKLMLPDGTDITGTHEEVACPVPTIIETSACVNPV